MSTQFQADGPEAQALADFLAKWRDRWPEWEIAEVFAPATRRPVALAWAALQQELLDAAWSGTDPAPGAAKLLWWQEELAGWARGARRHPLGVTLQRLAAPWPALGAQLPHLGRTREAPADLDQAFATLAPLAAAAAEVDVALFGGDRPSPELISLQWLATRALQHPAAAVPPALQASRGEAALPAWRVALAARRAPGVGGTPVERRLWAALARARLSVRPGQPLSRLNTLFVAWGAARN